MLLAGLWFDSMNSLNDLYRKGSVFFVLPRHILVCIGSAHYFVTYVGFKVETPDGVHTYRAMLLLCTIDLPAQGQLLNMKYFNGKHACAHCEEEGVPRPSCPRVRNWPYRGETALRTRSSIISSHYWWSTCELAIYTSI